MKPQASTGGYIAYKPILSAEIVCMDSQVRLVNMGIADCVNPINPFQVYMTQKGAFPFVNYYILAKIQMPIMYYSLVVITKVLRKTNNYLKLFNIT